MRFFKFLAAFVLAFMFVVPTTASASTASNNLIHYVALGDSLAAGITSDGTLGFGYSDNIAAELQAVYPSVGYHNTFAFPLKKSKK